MVVFKHLTGCYAFGAGPVAPGDLDPESLDMVRAAGHIPRRYDFTEVGHGRRRRPVRTATATTATATVTTATVTTTSVVTATASVTPSTSSARREPSPLFTDDENMNSTDCLC